MHSSPVEFARATVADERAILPLMELFNHEEGIQWQPDLMGPALRRLLGDPALGLGVVARESGRDALAGYGLATFGFDIEFAGHDAFVTELFVAPPFRGRGVGRGLLEHLTAALEGRGAHAVHLFVRHGNHGARALYERLGFQEVPRVVMTRRLGAIAPGEPPAAR